MVRKYRIVLPILQKEVAQNALRDFTWKPQVYVRKQMCSVKLMTNKMGIVRVVIMVQALNLWEENVKNNDYYQYI